VTFRQRALDEIKRVKWDPAWGEERISNMIATRPDWCISRQRIWGVPIALFLCKKCNQPLQVPEAYARVVEVFQQHGADAWYDGTAEKMLPADAKCATANCDGTEFRRETDILDVWIDSAPVGLRCSKRSLSCVSPAIFTPKAAINTVVGFTRPYCFRSACAIPRPIASSPPPAGRSTSRARAFSKSLGNGVDPWISRSGSAVRSSASGLHPSIFAKMFRQ